jgi:hypothetical protein
MNRWMWQAITEITKAMVAKGQSGYVTLIVIIGIFASVAMLAIGVGGPLLSVKTGIDLLR